MTISLSLLPSGRFFRRVVLNLPVGLILLLGLISYANSLGVPVQFDDPVAVRIYSSIGTDLFSWNGFLGTPRWLADITFAMNRSLHGEQVTGYHVVNLAIHLLSAVVLYRFVRLAIEALQQTCRVSDDTASAFLYHIIPFSAAALFVCHPVQTQAVTYIVQRYTTLATLFYLGNLVAYVQARLACVDGTRGLYVKLSSIAGVLLALLAMKSKEIAFTLPLMAVVCEIMLFRGQLVRKRLFLLLVAALLLFIPLQLLYAHGTGGAENLSAAIQSSTTETQGISRADYLITQFRVVATYLRLLVLPVNQNVDYDYPVYHSLANLSVLAALLLHIALSGIAILIFMRSQRSFASGNPAAGIAMRLASLGICWFYLALGVESSVIPIRDVIYEHRIYLPSAGFFIALSAVLAGCVANRPRYHNALQVAMALLCLVLATGTILRNRIWSNEMTMLLDVMSKSPDKARVRYSVGMLYFKKIMPEKALPFLVRAVELDANTDKYRVALNDALWIIRKYKGRCSDVSKYYASDRLANPEEMNAKWAGNYNNLGLAYEHAGDLQRARDNYLKAVSVNPVLDLAWCNLALVAALQNDDSTVKASLEKLKALNPQLEEAAVKMIWQER